MEQLYALSELISLDSLERTEIGYEVLRDGEVEALKNLKSKGVDLSNILINCGKFSEFMRADYIDTFNHIYLLIPHLDTELLQFYPVNKQIEQQEKYWEEKNYSHYLMLIERRFYSYVVYELLELLREDTADVNTIWDLFHHIWLDSEYLNGNIDRDILMTLFELNPKIEEQQDKLRDVYKSETIEIYRGEASKSVPFDEGALSWTLDKERALFFANRFNSSKKLLLKAKVDICDVLAYFTERDESEVIVESCSLSDVTVEEL